MNKISSFELWKRLSENFSLIPLNGKIPIEKDWPKFCVEKRIYRFRNFRGKNAGVACGPASGVIVVDEDLTEKFKAICKENNWDLPETFTVSTGSGVHYYYKYPENGNEYGCRSIKAPNDPKQTIFDIKGMGGQVVAPGSIHPDTGKTYEIIKNIDIAPAPERVRKLALRDDPEPKETAKTNTFQWNGKIDNLPVKTKIKDLIRHGTPKGQPSEAIMIVVNALVWSNLSDAEIFSIFDKYDIGEKYREKRRAKKRWLQGRINKARKYVSQTSQNDAASIRKDMQDGLNTGKEPTTFPNQIKVCAADPALTVISASDLLKKEFPKDPFVIGQGILPEQGGLILAGESGTGKSLLLLDWAIHLALGQHLLNGKLIVLKPRRVVVFQSENLLFMMQKYLKKMLEGLQITDSLNINFSTPFRYDIKSEKCVSQMIDVIGKNEADVIIADPLSSFHQVSENENVPMRSVLDQFTNISHVTGAAVLISHHFGKPQPGRGEAYRLRGASSIKDWADTLITIEPRSHQHKDLRSIRFIKVRYGVEPKPILLERDKTSLLHNLSQEEDLIVSPGELAEFLQHEFNGKVEMKKTFKEEAAKKFDCSERTILNVLKKAVERKLIAERKSRRKVTVYIPKA